VTVVQSRPLRYGELDSGRVVDGLLSLARRVGVANVTMRALAAELGTSAPSLYYHVPNKQAALDLLAEALLEQVPLPTAGSWEERLTALYAAGRDALLTVDGITTVLQSRPVPASGQRLDATALDVLTGAGFDAATAATAQSLLSIHLLGSVSLEQALAGTPARLSRRKADARFAFGMRVILQGLRSERRAR
jgi:AcrR family transcriptional regulator